jgi:DNA-directed RNA polymerase subunit RPC12/RpoP
VDEQKCTGCGAALELGVRRAAIVRCPYCGTNHVLPQPTRQSVVKHTHQVTVQLVRAIAEDFTLAELRDLIVDLNGRLPAPYQVSYDDIGGTTISGKARELVLWCQRRNVLDALIEAVRTVRPTIDLG